MKNLIIVIILSIIAILAGGFIGCFPQFIPFAITLISLGTICFTIFGILAIAERYNFFD